MKRATKDVLYRGKDRVILTVSLGTEVEDDHPAVLADPKGFEDVSAPRSLFNRLFGRG